VEESTHGLIWGTVPDFSWREKPQEHQNRGCPGWYLNWVYPEYKLSWLAWSVLLKLLGRSIFACLFSYINCRVNIIQARNQYETGCLLPPSCWFLAWPALWPWRWRWHVPSKRLLTFTSLQGIFPVKLWFLTKNVSLPLLEFILHLEPDFRFWFW
jgi:hypothetical protein